MREIKFRSWNGKEIIFYNNWFTLDQQKTLCFEDSEEHTYIDNSDVDCPNRVVLMQYTGLKDKNGKEIYEYDICAYQGINDYCIIEYEQGGFIIKWLNVPCFVPAQQPINWTNNELTIVGNVFKNSELLDFNPNPINNKYKHYNFNLNNLGNKN